MRSDSGVRPALCLAVSAGAVCPHPSQPQQCCASFGASVCTDLFSLLVCIWVVFPPSWVSFLLGCWLELVYQCKLCASGREGSGRGDGLGRTCSPAASVSLYQPCRASHHTLRQKSKGHFSYSQDRCLDSNNRQ